MAFAAAVAYEIHPGHETEAERILLLLREQTRREPGCLAYEPHRDPEAPSQLFLYELYVDRSAYEAHQSAEYFRRYAVGEMAEHVSGRRVERYETISPHPLES